MSRLNNMNNLSVRQLHHLRLAIFENAAALHREAEILLQNDMYSRAYLLAHFCVEELGKLPLLFSAICQLEKSDTVDWKTLQKRLSNHEEKIASQNGHFYAFGRTSEVAGDRGIPWLIAANHAIQDTYTKKNLSTYVDVKDGAILRPSDAIDKRDAIGIIAYASECLHAHQRSEYLTNPVLYEAHESGTL